MESLKTESGPPPPAVIGSIKAGFDTIAAHLGAIIMPLVLDLFLWLGPRLSVEKLILSFMPQLTESWKALGVTPEQLQQMNQANLEALPQLNLFWLLRTFPIGISSLASSQFFSQKAGDTPLGAPSVMQVASEWDLLTWTIVLSLLGWIGGAVYFFLVSRLIPRIGNSRALPMAQAIGQSLLISFFWCIIVFILGMPILLFMALLLAVNPVIGQVAIFIFSLMSMWLVVPLFFWPHGVFLRNENVFTAIWSSWRFARFTLASSSLFVLMIFMLSVGLNYLWAMPPKDSWMALIGIVGHAFVTTALLAASFIYYRDMYQWLSTALERIKGKPLMRI
ncbi:MAG: hypothetical protein AB1649_16760 [Chloroflexota bacterium]